MPKEKKSKLKSIIIEYIDPFDLSKKLNKLFGENLDYEIVSMSDTFPIYSNVFHKIVVLKAIDD